MPSHAEMLAKLPDECDLLVIGGGITGAGIARDAARRGLKTTLLEMRDLAYGTSSRSSKLVHGGLRYLETYEFSLVFEAVSERRVLMELAPHLVNPLGFMFPVYRGQKRGLWTISAGMWLYDGLSLFRSPKRHRLLKPKDVKAEMPHLRQEGLRGAPLYYDCSTDDARLTIEVAQDATEQGAVVASYCRAESFVKDESGRIQGVIAKDMLSGKLKEIKAHVVINATGPWADETIGMSEGRKAKLLRPTKGIHIVVSADKLPVKYGVTCFHPEDDRLLFVLPWGDSTYIGTTDTDYTGLIEDIAATSADVDYLITASNAHFPTSPITRDDVIATWAGLRPLIAPESEDSDVAESKISREHQILIAKDGLITIAGGKLTTFRRMAEEIVDSAEKILRESGALRGELRPTSSDKFPLPGGIGWPDDDDHEAVARQVSQVCAALRDETARLLADTYGMKALSIAERCVQDDALLKPLVQGRPEIMAQVDWAIDHEFSANISDIMIRRTQLFYRDNDQGLSAVQSIADRFVEKLNWSPEMRARSISEYEAEVALSRRWRREGSLPASHDLKRAL